MTQPSQSTSQQPSEMTPQDIAATSESVTSEESTEDIKTQDTVPSVAVPEENTVQGSESPPSYVKLAMRNMVKKGSKSLFHFALTTVGLLGVLIGLAYLTR